MSESDGDWGRALAALREALAPHGGESSVVRVEVRDDGTQVWSAETPAGPRWFTYTDARLQRVIPTEDARLPGAADLLGDSEILSWRPGRRAVAASSDGASVWKLFRRNRLERALKKHSQVLASRASLGPWDVAPIEHVDREASAIRFQRVIGEPVAIVRDAAKTWRHVGEGIRAFQGSVSCDELGSHDRCDELSVVSTLHRRYRTAFGREVESVDACVDVLSALAEPVGTRTLVPCHRDLHDGQFIAASDRVFVLDFDQLVAAEPEVDVANLTAHLVLRGLQRHATVSPGSDRACALEVLTGFEASSSDESHEALRFYQTATFLRLALLYGLRPRWRAIVPLLLRHARASLAELSHA